MTNKQIFVMAQGKGSRWKPDSRTGYIPPALYKQLVPIGDEVIITRTLRQLSQNGIKRSDIITISNGDFFPFIEYKSGMMTLREPVGSLINGMWITGNNWLFDSRVIFLLGDVVYSNNAIKEILSDEYQTTSNFFGRMGGNKYTGKEAKEIFAFSLPSGVDVQDFWKDSMKRLWQSNPDAKLWDLSVVEEMTTNFVQINDYTDDMDSPQEYDQFYEKLEKEALKDDERLLKNRNLPE